MYVEEKIEKNELCKIQEGVSMDLPVWRGAQVLLL